jgi:integrase
MARIALTDRLIQGLKTDAIQEDFYDDLPKTRGLFLRVAKGGRKAWGLLYTAPGDGKRVRVSFGTYPATSLAQARAKAMEAHQALEQGKDPSKPAGNKPKTRTLSDAEIRALWARLPVAMKRSKACQRILKLGLVTAQRPGEICGLDRRELNLGAKLWTIPEERSKNRLMHAVPLSDMAVSVIEEALTDVGNGRWLFPAKDGDGPIPVEVLDKTLARALEPSEKRPQGRLGLADFTPHDLRRTALSNFAAMGIPPITAGAVANHKSVTKAGVTLSVYTQYDYAPEKREALDAWAQKLSGIIG